MSTLQYTVIKNVKQYNQYCAILEEFIVSKSKSKEQRDTVELLTLLIEKWDADHNTFADADPIVLLRYLMDENKLRATDMTELLGVSKSLFSDIQRPQW